jgi:anthranilate phosphoribosyltransferase
MEAMRLVMAAIMQGECSEVEIAAILTALRVKGEAVSEIAGAAQIMQELATPIATRRVGLLDTCGTGGDQLHTFNISTAAAFVVAAVGVPVPKHGNRSVSSASGSADVLEALGVNIQLSPERVTACLDELGIAFCFAPLLHGAMRFAAPVRKQLRFRTIFNLLGPLTNPARAEFQLVGAHRPETARKLAFALSRLGRRHALVVCGASQLDEVSLWGETQVFEVVGENVVERTWSAATFGLPECRAADLRVSSAQESAAVIREVFAGRAGPARNMVLANAAAGLLAAEKLTEPEAAVAHAAAALDSGAVQSLLQDLVRLTNA